MNTSIQIGISYIDAEPICDHVHDRFQHEAGNITELLYDIRIAYPDNSPKADNVNDVSLLVDGNRVMFALRESNNTHEWSVYFTAHDIFSEFPVATLEGSVASVAVNLLALNATIEHIFDLHSKGEIKEWYVISRDKETQVISTTPGNDPMHGYGSWNMYSGPWPSYEEAAQVLVPRRK